MALSLLAFALPVPEGDTIHRTAARLRPALIGRRLEKFEAPRLVGLRPRIGSTIESVEDLGNCKILTARLGRHELKVKVDEDTAALTGAGWLGFPERRTRIYVNGSALPHASRG